MLSGFQPNSNLGWYKVEMGLKFWPWLKPGWKPDVDSMFIFWPWLLGENEVKILTLVEIELTSWCCFNVEILTMVDMRLKFWRCLKVEILMLFQLPKTSFQHCFNIEIWGPFNVETLPVCQLGVPITGKGAFIWDYMVLGCLILHA